MTAQEVYRSRAYSPDRVARRYLRYWDATNRFTLFECLENGLTIREVDTDGEGLPDYVLTAARAAGCQVRLD